MDLGARIWLYFIRALANKGTRTGRGFETAGNWSGGENVPLLMKLLYFCFLFRMMPKTLPGSRSSHLPHAPYK